jgi:hypothetical protein
VFDNFWSRFLLLYDWSIAPKPRRLVHSYWKFINYMGSYQVFKDSSNGLVEYFRNTCIYTMTECKLCKAIHATTLMNCMKLISLLILQHGNEMKQVKTKVRKCF